MTTPKPARWRALLAVSDRLPSDRPWKPPRKATTLGRPVWWRASFRAASTASVPELRQERPHGRAAHGRDGGELLGQVGVGRQVEVARAVVQDVVDLPVDGGVDSGWAWPAATTAMPALKSRKRLPSTSSITRPRARRTTSG